MAEGEKKFSTPSSLKPGSYVLIDDEPCQVKSMEKSKPGKHGAAKARITAMGVFKDTKKTLLKPADADIQVPNRHNEKARDVSVSRDTLQIMDTENYQTYNVAKPQDMQGISSGVEVEYIHWGDYVKIVRKR